MLRNAPKALLVNPAPQKTPEKNVDSGMEWLLSSR